MKPPENIEAGLTGRLKSGTLYPAGVEIRPKSHQSKVIQGKRPLEKQASFT
jgi:hypothetical protein